jgi:uncharacterized membrane protein
LQFEDMNCGSSIAKSTMLSQPFSIPAILIGILAPPLLFGLLPPNPIYGVRTKETMQDPQLWHAANRLGGLLLLVSSMVYLVFAWLYPMAGRHDPNFSRWLNHLLSFLLPLAASTIYLLLWIKRR